MRFPPKKLGLAGLAVIAVTVAIVAIVRKESPSAGKGAEAGRGGSGDMREVRGARPVLERKDISAATAQSGRRLHASPTTGEWAKIAGTLTPAQAKAMLEKDRLEEKNVEARAQRAWLIINQLCRNGFPREAWDLIEKEEGSVRTGALGGFFRDAELPKAELLGMMDKMYSDERAASLFGYWSRFSPDEFLKVDMSEFPLRSKMEADAFRKTLSEMMAQGYDPANPALSQPIRMDLLALAAKQANAGTLNYGDFKVLLQNDPSKDGFLYWESLKQVNPEVKVGQATFDGTDSMIIRAMAVQDGERVMNMAIVPNSQEGEYMHIALSEWLKKDYSNAERWYEGRKGSLSEEQEERVKVAFVRAEVARGEYDRASEWMAQIKSPRWSGAVWWERKEIKKRAAQ